MRFVFEPAHNKLLANEISIKSPNDFRKSIHNLKSNGLTLHEKKALVLARTRAKLQLRRHNLSIKERKQMYQISKIRIPK